MEWRHQPLLPAEHAAAGPSQIAVVVYDDGLVRDALITRCATDLATSGYRLGGTCSQMRTGPAGGDAICT